MSDDLTRLREIAAAATPGEWCMATLNFGDVGDETFSIWAGGQDEQPVTEIAATVDRFEDHEFIATFDPPTVTALLDRAERAERERDEFVKMRDAFKREHEWRKNRDAELAALRAAVTGLADQWWNQYDGTEPPEHVNLGWAANQLRAMLTDEGDNQ